VNGAIDTAAVADPAERDGLTRQATNWQKIRRAGIGKPFHLMFRAEGGLVFAQGR